MPMPTINVLTLQTTGTFAPGVEFEWINTIPATNPATNCAITNCDTWCTASTYSVPQQRGTTPGSVKATVKMPLRPGTYNYNSSCTNVPGQPHIDVDTPIPTHQNK